jgi:putative protease
MSGMISERSANRGSCAQSCRKDYVLTDVLQGQELDRGYLISTKDLAAHDHLPALAELGVGCLKIEGRKKKPEYVATVTRGYRDWLDGIERGTFVAPDAATVAAAGADLQPRLHGRHVRRPQGRDYITRTQPDNAGVELGVVVGRDGAELLIEVREPLAVGDGVGFEPPWARGHEHRLHRERRPHAGDARRRVRQAINTRGRVPAGGASCGPRTRRCSSARAPATRRSPRARGPVARGWTCGCSATRAGRSRRSSAPARTR